MKNLIARAKHTLNRYLFGRTCRKIRKTSPLAYQKNPDITVASMVSHDTVDMYLIAIKSFMTHFGDAKIEAISDGSLTRDDIHLLKHHVPGIDFSDARDIDTGDCPSYISWKRLFRIIELSQRSYVIQLDSDIIALSPLVEIYNKAVSNEGFMIADGRWREMADRNFLHSLTRRWKHIHPQALAEREFYNLPYFEEGDKYLRGCAGFAGYPRGSLTVERVQTLSRQIEERIGSSVWREWGSEQTATNCLISKSNNPEVLPWPRYQNYLFPPARYSVESAALIHFIGTTRFADGTYRITVQKLIRRLEARKSS
ncbi:MAG: hypothetical protein CMK32_14205 [Porticoccaceae bacterium]|nr:hypothetical protein [Porticoccaceae bacterium]